VTRNRCTTRLLDGPARFTTTGPATAAAVRAVLARDRRVVARGTVGSGGVVRLGAARRPAAGRYELRLLRGTQVLRRVPVRIG
jgi:hypothetical protein